VVVVYLNVGGVRVSGVLVAFPAIYTL